MGVNRMEKVFEDIVIVFILVYMGVVGMKG